MFPTSGLFRNSGRPKCMEEFSAGVRSEDFFEPGLLGGLIFGGEDFNDIALF